MKVELKDKIKIVASESLLRAFTYSKYRELVDELAINWQQQWCRTKGVAH